MRITRFLAMLIAIAGVAEISPAAAETSNVRVANAATPEGLSTSADQYRHWRGDRYRGRGYGRGYGYRYRSYGYRYRPRYYGYPRWRGRVVCRTSLRWGRPHRVCWRR